MSSEEAIKGPNIRRFLQQSCYLLLVFALAFNAPTQYLAQADDTFTDGDIPVRAVGITVRQHPELGGIESEVRYSDGNTFTYTMFDTAPEDLGRALAVLKQDGVKAADGGPAIFDLMVDLPDEQRSRVVDTMNGVFPGQEVESVPSFEELPAEAKDFFSQATKAISEASPAMAAPAAAAAGFAPAATVDEMVIPDVREKPKTRLRDQVKERLQKARAMITVAATRFTISGGAAFTGLLAAGIPPDHAAMIGGAQGGFSAVFSLFSKTYEKVLGYPKSVVKLEEHELAKLSPEERARKRWLPKWALTPARLITYFPIEVLFYSLGIFVLKSYGYYDGGMLEVLFGGLVAGTVGTPTQGFLDFAVEMTITDEKRKINEVAEIENWSDAKTEKEETKHTDKGRALFAVNSAIVVFAISLGIPESVIAEMGSYALLSVVGAFAASRYFFVKYQTELDKMEVGIDVLGEKPPRTLMQKFKRFFEPVMKANNSFQEWQEQKADKCINFLRKKIKDKKKESTDVTSVLFLENLRLSQKV